MTALSGTITPPPAPATPAVPASTVAVQNPGTYPVTVVITGGTMTAVIVNGVTVGTGAGTYIVPAAGSISMTYTVAPTWAWSNAALGSPAAVPVTWDGAATPTLTAAGVTYSGQANAGFAGVPQSVLNAIAGKNVLEALPA